MQNPNLQNVTSITSQKRSNALPPPPDDVVAQALGQSSVKIEWLAGDGSDRCYYRVLMDAASKGPASYVLMQLSGNDAAALKQNGYDWVNVANILASRKIPVPELKVALPEYAALVIQDYGDVMLEEMIMGLCREQKTSLVEEYYGRCFRIIAQLLSIPHNANEIWCKRAFDFEKYQWELEFFHKQFLVNAAQIHLSSSQKETFDQEVQSVCKYLSEFSLYFVHRDFHSRNIMYKDDQLALIDFQDARLGSCAYDLVSLVFDNYIPFDLDFRLRLLEEGIAVIAKHARIDAKRALRSHIKAVILQRQLKAIGTYGYLTFEKKRGNYLQYVKPGLSTLAPEVIYDKRWPFLSKKLIAIMNSTKLPHAP